MKSIDNLKSWLISVRQYFSYRSVCEELTRYKGLHSGQRCFIIGTGPSLTVDDLEKLKGEVTIASNRIFEIFDRTNWRPVYYMNQDVKLIDKFRDSIATLQCKRKFMPIDVKKLFEGSEDISFFVLRHKEFYPNTADFSTHINHFLGQGFTVTYGAMQLAYYMGFTEVYLLGIDHNYAISLDENGVPVYQEGVKEYFDGSKASNVGLNLPRVVESTMAYITAQRFAQKRSNFKVYNATRGGRLDVFPRVNLDDIL